MAQNKIIEKIFGDSQKKARKRLEAKVKLINEKTDKYKQMSDDQLKEQTKVLKKRLTKKTVTLDTLLPDAFALVREASGRVLKMRHFDVQLMGGIALHEGNVAEMKTGEGKTLVATLPVFLNALSEKGVHIVTVNDYLAKRDAGWMGKVYSFLGIKVGVILSDESFIYEPGFVNDKFDDERMKPLKPCSRKEAYDADVTYGTNNEFAFDYLRDNMVNDAYLLRQRELNFAIIDEVDSILIDEARTPLIISAPAGDNPDSYYQFANIVNRLTPDDYEIEEKRRTVALTDQGMSKIEAALGVKNIYDEEHTRLVYHLNQALRAETLFKRDREYVVTNDGEVMIVDEHTGRLMHGRRYSEGLHQAIEAKEKVQVKEESMTLATISFQNYFRLYKKLSGMTGTAMTEAEEFQQIYNLDVIDIPSNKPLIRHDKNDLIYKTVDAKLKAIVETIKAHHKVGRPVLVGSGSIANNEQIADYLDQAGLKYELLNAKNNEREATIVAKAGEKGAITLATNMAGRGTDIVLGEGVRELGGLVVIGSERHESRRIDNQLRGRGGRQGDPGETQFFVSTEDDLMRIFQGERIKALMDRLGVADDMPIQNKAVTKTLEAAQERVEGYNYDIRKSVVQYDNVINRHRRVVYGMRHKILSGDNIKSEINRLLTDKVEEMVALPPKLNPDFKQSFIDFFPGMPEKNIKKIINAKNQRERLSLAKSLTQEFYQAKEDELTEVSLRKVEREVYMQVLDVLWMQHLEDMQNLREGIHWRSVGQRDPLVEYRAESQKLFNSLQQTLRDEVLTTIFSISKHELSAALTDDNYETALTEAAEGAVEKGVHEISAGVENIDDEFKSANAKTTVSKKNTKKTTRKKKKAQRQNRKKARR